MVVLHSFRVRFSLIRLKSSSCFITKTMFEAECVIAFMLLWPTPSCPISDGIRTQEWEIWQNLVCCVVRYRSENDTPPPKLESWLMGTVCLYMCGIQYVFFSGFSVCHVCDLVCVVCSIWYVLCAVFCQCCLQPQTSSLRSEHASLRSVGGGQLGLPGTQPCIHFCVP